MSSFRKYGFTLIELLVVIAIIGILIGMAIAAFAGTRASARDAKRQSDLEQIRSALELYRADNGRYGSTGVGPGWCTVLYGCSSAQPWYNDVAGALISGGYLSELPQDPIYKDVSGKDYFFSCTGGSAGRCTKYELYALVERAGSANGSFNPTSTGGVPCACTGNYNYKVLSP